MTTKRFVIRKSLIGKNEVITFTNKKGESVSYNHDEVYNTHKERFNAMNCFTKYKSYTNTNCIPAFCRDMKISQQFIETNCDKCLLLYISYKANVTMNKIDIMSVKKWRNCC